MRYSALNIPLRLSRFATLAFFLYAGCGKSRDGEHRQSSASSRSGGRDFIVLDSLSRFVPTDSLYHLLRRQLRPGDTNAILAAVTCETRRLAWRYGAVPADFALRRMLDTVWRDVDGPTRRRMENYPGRFAATSDSGCADFGNPAPAEVSGIPLNLQPRSRP